MVRLVALPNESLSVSPVVELYEFRVNLLHEHRQRTPSYSSYASTGGPPS